MRLNFNRTLQIGYGISIFMLVIVGFISYRTVQQLLDSNRSVSHSNLVIQKLERTMSVMKDAETGQRGYLLTNSKVFLQPYNEAYRQAGALLNEVTGLTQDNPIQQRHMQAIRLILQRRLTILQSLVNMRQQGKAIASADLVAGKSTMDDLRQAIDKAENDEQALLNDRIAALNRYAIMAPLFIVLAILLGVLISILSYIKVTRDIREKDRLQAELTLKEQETAAFNEELTAANEEITAANEQLTVINEELSEAREEVAAMNVVLEEKVALRTRALQESEEETQALNEELTAINEELASANEEYQATNEELVVARDQMEKSGRLFRAIAQHIPGSLVMVIGHDHQVLTLEGDLLERLNYNTHNHVGKHLAKVTSSERYAASREFYERVLAGEQFRINHKGDGDTDYQVDFVPLLTEAEQVYAGLIIALDITDLKKGEERSAKLAAIIESSDDAIIGKTLDGIITSWNRGAERIFGYTQEEMIGESIFRLIPEDRQEEEPLLIARLKKGERVDHFETKRRTREGILVDLSLTISPIRDKEGRITGVSKIARDISERKQDEVRKNDFIGMVSHELKTPLTSLNAILQVANQKLRLSEDAFLAGAMNKANIQMKRMTTMINSFLNISRLESGKLLIEKGSFGLDKLIDEVIEEMKLTVTSHAINLHTCEKVNILADRDKISSVISNLLSNAVKYSPKGKVIGVNCVIRNGEVQVSVHDEGMGIKPNDLAKIFDRYYRVEGNHTRHISGFGIGLYLSAEIIRHHNGRIWAESIPGEGSTFYFSLPLNAVAGENT